MAQNIPIYIPTYISDAQYNPARVLPRIFFYNGQLECIDWYTADSGNVAVKQTAFPYFDNYNVITGSFPSEGSVSLLFNNEAPVYGNLPTASLFTEYWDTYVGLLYNPTTRLFNCEAIIPLADYIKMELNDIVEWRGNYYHLRAMNDYNLSNGEVKLQLLGPLLPDILPEILPAIKNTTTTTTVAPTTTTSTTTTPPCAGCRTYYMKATGSGANVDFFWIDCDGTPQSIVGMGNNDEVAVCSITSGSYPYYSASVGSGILSSCQSTCSCDCYDFTQSYATGPYSYYPCSQAVGIGIPTYGSFTGVDIGIVTCISNGSALIGLNPVAPNTGSGGCTGCATTTTTTTSTTTTTTQPPTTTTTTQTCAGCRQYTFTAYTDDTANYIINWIDCDSVSQSVYLNAYVSNPTASAVLCALPTPAPYAVFDGGTGSYSIVSSSCGNICSSSCNCSDGIVNIDASISYYQCGNNTPQFDSFPGSGSIVKCWNSDLPSIGLILSGSNSDTGCFCPTTTTTTSTTSTTTTTTSTTTTTTTTTQAPTTTTTTQACCQIDVLTNSSLDVDIDTIDVDGTAVTVTGGSLPNTPGNGTTVCTTITGTVDVTVSTFNSVAGQRITFCDSNGVCTCYNITGTGPATWTWTNVFIDCITPPTLIAEDGSC